MFKILKNQIYQKDDKNYKLTLSDYEYWLNLFTTDREGNKKGIVEIIR
jgi:hypothetical protein